MCWARVSASLRPVSASATSCTELTRISFQSKKQSLQAGERLIGLGTHGVFPADGVNKLLQHGSGLLAGRELRALAGEIENVGDAFLFDVGSCRSHDESFVLSRENCETPKDKGTSPPPTSRHWPPKARARRSLHPSSGSSSVIPSADWPSGAGRPWAKASLMRRVTSKLFFTPSSSTK